MVSIFIHYFRLTLGISQPQLEHKIKPHHNLDPSKFEKIEIFAICILAALFVFERLCLPRWTRLLQKKLLTFTSFVRSLTTDTSKMPHQIRQRWLENDIRDASSTADIVVCCSCLLVVLLCHRLPQITIECFECLNASVYTGLNGQKL